VRTVQEVADAISDMAARGAQVIGLADDWGIVLGLPKRDAVFKRPEICFWNPDLQP